MSILFRAAPRAVLRAPLRTAPARQVRSLHIENTPYTSIPGGTKNKTALAIKFIVFGAVGWSLPVYMAWYSHQKTLAAE